MTDQICPFCKGILPLDTDEPREFYRTRATSWGSACYTTPFLHNGEIVERDNVFSPDKKYCYERLRVWEPKLEYALFILLNPLSEGNDDAGIRCVKLAQKQKFGGCYIVYLHSLITSDSKLLKNEDPISLETKKNTIEMILPKVKKVIYGWGSKAKPILKVREPLWLKEIISEPFCYGKTKEGYPCNPLTVDCDEKLIIFR